MPDPKPARCPGCRRMVLDGEDADTGLPVAAEPQPLGKLGEALALLAGRDTFSLRRIGGRLEIAGRDQFRIRGQPAGANGVDILVRHNCEYTVADLPRIRTRLPHIRVSASLPDQPPY